MAHENDSIVIGGHGNYIDWTPDQREPWMDDSLCTQTDPEMFFPEKGGSTRSAKKVCASCEVREQCLAYALEHDERFGIWGGVSERERRRMQREASGQPTQTRTRNQRPWPADGDVILRQMHGRGALDVEIAAVLDRDSGSVGRRRRGLGLAPNTNKGRRAS